MEEYIAQLMQYERVLDPLDNGNEFDYWIEYAKRMESRKMKYTIELTNKQKAQMDCIMEIVHRYVGFNPKLEPIKAVNVEDTNEYQIGYKVGYNKGHLEGVIKGNKDGYNKGVSDSKVKIEQAYKDGYNKGHEECKDLLYTENDMSEIIDATTDIEYNRGVEDLAKAIEWYCPLNRSEREKYYGKDEAILVVAEDEPHELVKAWKAYKEKKQAEEIKVGDEVFMDDRKAVVSRVLNGLYNIVYYNGDTNCVDRSFIAKTGKHYDIENMLKELGE